MEFLKKLKKLWFPSVETKVQLAKISEAFNATLAKKNGVLNEYKAGKIATEKALRKVEGVFQSYSNRLRELRNCFEDKNNLYEAINELFSEMQSVKSDLDSAYRELNQNKASKDDFYNWSKRQKTLWNGFSGRGGKKVRSGFNPKSIFDKYTRSDLDRFKANIQSAKSEIGRLKSRKRAISLEIETIKSDIRHAKKLCAYVKTPEGKNEKNDLKKNIESLSEQISQLRSVLSSQNAKIADQALSIKSTEKKWRDERRKIKLSQ